MNLKTIAQGFGAAVLICLLKIWPLISPHHSVLYHSFLPMQNLVWGVFIDLTAVTLLAALLFYYLGRSEGGQRNAVWALVGAVLASALAADTAAVWGKSPPHLWSEILFYGTLLGSLALCLFRPLSYQNAIRAVRSLLLVVGCTLLWMVPQLLFLGLRPQPADRKVPVVAAGPSSVKQTTPGGGRIVWLLFDELSYDQTFEHRVNGLSMPAFDKMKSESVSFSDLQPVGNTTERVVPSLLMGHVVTGIRSDFDGNLSVALAGQRGWRRFDPHATLFSDAQHLGWTTGIVGWYNPYCRILAGTLDYCFWRMGNGDWDGTSPTQSGMENALAPVVNVIRAWRHQQAFSQQLKHAADLAALMPQARTLIRDQKIGFVFIHLPVPHPPGIYDRRPPHRRPTGTYLDNLVLADRVLADLMRTVNETPAAARTTVIVCSDHSWRIGLWRPAGQWSQEEEAATNNRFDPRPVLLIHFPGQSTEHDLTEPFDEIKMHDIIERMLRGQEPVLTKAWLAGNASMPVTGQP